MVFVFFVRRGCGKSSICRRLILIEKRWSLFSLDTLIQYESQGRSIAQIVADHGAHPCPDRMPHGVPVSGYPRGSCATDWMSSAHSHAPAVRLQTTRLEAFPRGRVRDGHESGVYATVGACTPPPSHRLHGGSRLSRPPSLPVSSASSLRRSPPHMLCMAPLLLSSCASRSDSSLSQMLSDEHSSFFAVPAFFSRLSSTPVGASSSISTRTERRCTVSARYKS